MKNSKEKNSKKYLNKVIGIIDKPYFREMGLYGITDRVEQKYVLKKVYGFDVRIYKNRNTYNSRGECIYMEDRLGYWEIREFDLKGNCIYYENSNDDRYYFAHVIKRIL
jgi:hypothetical protein